MSVKEKYMTWTIIRAVMHKQDKNRLRCTRYARALVNDDTMHVLASYPASTCPHPNLRMCLRTP